MADLEKALAPQLRNIEALGNQRYADRGALGLDVLTSTPRALSAEIQRRDGAA